jgi:hypothetical protein
VSCASNALTSALFMDLALLMNSLYSSLYSVLIQ